MLRHRDAVKHIGVFHGRFLVGYDRELCCREVFEVICESVYVRVVECCLDLVKDAEWRRLDVEYRETFYKPTKSYERICEMMLDAAGVDVTRLPRKACSKIIMDKKFTDTLVVMDNRIDSYMDYICGMFDRIRMDVEPVKIPSAISTAGDGIFYTPLAEEFWGVNVIGKSAYKLSATPVSTLYNDFVSELPLTRTNAKMYNTYANMIKFYGDNKTLDINQRVVTMIK